MKIYVQNSYTHVHSTLIHNSQKAETTQMFISRWMDKQMWYTHIPINEILLSLKKGMKSWSLLQCGCTSKTLFGIKEVSCKRPHVVWLLPYDISRKESPWGQKVVKKRKEWEMTTSWLWSVLWGDEKVLKLGREDGCTTMNTLNTFHFKISNYPVYDFSSIFKMSI